MVRLSAMLFVGLFLFLADSSASARGRRGRCQPCYPVCSSIVRTLQDRSQNSNLYYPTLPDLIPGNGIFYSWGQLLASSTVGNDTYIYDWHPTGAMMPNFVYIVTDDSTDKGGSLTQHTAPSLAGTSMQLIKSDADKRYSHFHQATATGSFYVRVYYKQTGTMNPALPDSFNTSSERATKSR